MMTNSKKIPKECKFLSEVYSELPKNCLFNKGATGAGGTTIALIDNHPTIICVPSIELINNKVLQVKENKKDLYPSKLLGVYSNTNDIEIINFLKENKVPKIMVTYDSLERVAKFVDTNAYNILIDEYHSLFLDYVFRNKAVQTVLNNYKRFKNFTFMSATPIDEEFLLDELMDIDIENAVWENVLEVKVNPVKCERSIIKTVKVHIDRILRGELDGNYYFFVNSINFIEKIIKNCNLNDNNCRVIYSNYNKRILPIKNSKTTDPVKKINFLTKTTFQGCDIYDEDGKIYILSDGNLAHTLVDISTQLIQIAGRIRDSKYNNVIHHVFTHTRYSGLENYEDFKIMMQNNIKEDDSYYEDILDMKPENRMRAAEGKFTYYTVNKKEGTIRPDKNKQKIDLYNYRILNEVYKSKVNLGNEYIKNGLIVNSWYKNGSNPEILPVDNIINFKDTIVNLKEMCNGFYLFGEYENYQFAAYKAAAIKTYTFLEEAITLLNFEGIEKSKYVISNIKKKINSHHSKRTSETSDLNNISKLFKESNLFVSGSIIPTEQFKSILNNFYKELDIEKKASLKDAHTYFICQETKRMMDGVQKRVIVILNFRSFEIPG